MSADAHPESTPGAPAPVDVSAKDVEIVEDARVNKSPAGEATTRLPSTVAPSARDTGDIRKTLFDEMISQIKEKSWPDLMRRQAALRCLES